MKHMFTAAVMILATLLLGGCNAAGNPLSSPSPTAAPSPTPVSTPEPTLEPTPVPTPEKTDFSTFPNPTDLKLVTALPDIFTDQSGEAVVTMADYDARMQELRDLYQYYMYGFYPDTSGEQVSYAYDGGNGLTVTIEKDGKTVSFSAFVSVPNPDTAPMPEGGYPVIIDLSFAFGDVHVPFIPYQYAADNGYAVISFNTMPIAADDQSRSGIFYDLYPYTQDKLTQAGTLMAWTWGGSKIIDALELGLAGDTGLSAENIILTGVSRWGKAAAVAGAFEPRIKVTMPACSGAGGMALYRYKSAEHVYDYSDIGGPAAWNMGENEPLGSLKSSGESQWFNDTFKRFEFPSALPVDQHMLAALCGTEGRHLFITASYLYEDWTNPPAMYGTYLAAKKAYEFTGNADHIAVSFHKEGHAVIEEDLTKLIAYCNYHFYGVESPVDLETLKTTLYGQVESNRHEDLYALVGE